MVIQVNRKMLWYINYINLFLNEIFVYLFVKSVFFKMNKTKQDMLRTGRNTLNSELNALARNRTGGNSSQKESPINR